ncbi:N-acetylmuramoyl-L-alanine amidase family protein [Desulforamulus hydrothermalis]|uniref:Cell wall hydrolase/autolysin n=1 Tax=Desulforamulus hydrothermalis Lam5 = DSM 18033 TaxID=1121428 RepID=K8EG42_9FIRM|nr:N-acetylmuramoyl-L-alanine amidase [Desulforamulus hydrothermalis]CCO07651.1 Cell wall hydrolase/autolysin [Desulforamulus hydrothermalis Lam5 = DSM 18033]SHH24558.1 N-acetylmuramoyl-L-alanine amidase [Desulforamulus hydrothermalis Lam5 = DSM 18033]
MYIKGPYKKNSLPWLWLAFLIVFIGLGFFLKGIADRSEALNKPGPQRKPLPQQPVVIIDPGHGGSDPGACREGVMEKDINLAIAKRVARHAKGCKIKLTRDKDIDFTGDGVYSKEAERQDLDKRIELARQYRGDVFISIHVNTGLGRDRGAITYYDAANPGSTRLAYAVQKEINRLPGMPVKEPRADTFYLFKHLDIPVVIVETGWLCNLEERNRLQNPQYQEQLAKAIGRGTIQFLTKDNPKIH